MKHRYLKNVVTLKIDPDKCNGCGMCLEVCPHEVLALEARQVFIRDRDACMECGACSLNCPFGVITVQAGVGCASAVIRGTLTGEYTCDCGGCQC